MPIDSESLQITVTHALPGRLRLGLSHPPASAEVTERIIKGHEGVASACYTAPTRNLLIVYDTDRITTEEIILRASLSLSVDHRLRTVDIRSLGNRPPLGFLSVTAGLSLLAGHVLALCFPMSTAADTMATAGGLGTAAAIGEHVYQDLKDRGRFHPEVLSIGYLLLSLFRGRALKSASISWLMTFARHFLEPPEKVLRLEVDRLDATCDLDRCEYEARLTRELKDKGFAALIARLPQLLFGLYADMHSTPEDRIFKEMRNVTREHDHILEGLENQHHGIRMQVGL